MRQWKVIEVAHTDVTVVRQIDAMKGDRNIEINGRSPKRIIIWIVKRPAHDLVIRQKSATAPNSLTARRASATARLTSCNAVCAVGSSRAGLALQKSRSQLLNARQMAAASFGSISSVPVA